MAFFRTRVAAKTITVTLLALFVAAVGLLGWLNYTQGQEAAAAQVQSPDLLTYERVQALRRELSLSNLDLAAAGVSEEQTQATLTSLLDWYRQNRAELDRREAALVGAKTSLREAHQKIAIGPRDARVLGSVSELARARDAAQASRKGLLDGAVIRAEGGLTSSQRAILQTVRQNEGVAGLRRYVRVVPQEERAILERTAVERSRVAGTTAEQTLRLVVDRDAAAVSGVSSRVNGSLPAVSRAEERVLPMPAELRQQVLDAALASDDTVQREQGLPLR